jgi:hypothetical protein
VKLKTYFTAAAAHPPLLTIPTAPYPPEPTETVRMGRGTRRRHALFSEHEENPNMYSANTRANSRALKYYGHEPLETGELFPI